MSRPERRSTPCPALAGAAARSEAGPGLVTGLAAVFYDGTAGTEYVLWDDDGSRAVERIDAHAFDRALREKDDVRCLLNHDAGRLLGRTASGTLKLSKAKAGLRYECGLPPTELGRSVSEMLWRGDLSGSSFAFVVEKESWEDQKGPGGKVLAVRTVESVRLFDVGPVTFPAYAAATAGVRAAPPGLLAARLAAIRARAVEVTERE